MISQNWVIYIYITKNVWQILFINNACIIHIWFFIRLFGTLIEQMLPSRVLHSVCNVYRSMSLVRSVGVSGDSNLEPFGSQTPQLIDTTLSLPVISPRPATTTTTPATTLTPGLFHSTRPGRGFRKNKDLSVVGNSGSSNRDLSSRQLLFSLS